MVVTLLFLFLILLADSKLEIMKNNEALAVFTYKPV